MLIQWLQRIPLRLLFKIKMVRPPKASVTQRVVDEMVDEMSEDSNMRGKRFRSQQHEAKENDPSYSGVGPEETMESNPTRPAKTGLVVYYPPMDPYASVRSTPTNAKPKEQVLFDASDSQDADGDPPLEYNWDFGDGTPVVKTNKPFANHAYDEPGSYPATCTVVDKYGNPAEATCSQRVMDPQKPTVGPPYAALSSSPKETFPNQPVEFECLQRVMMRIIDPCTLR
eukprot:TRINITY_DN8952_c0_g1_i1.p1 TRINITY_DN8952_c0_g1~~TRINITY_DN8952_c0_g1_i1.p1  ORF type:complete len:227 (-),score=15.01 TRINITY_DN8952_c0_g1_i1:47-727(-)